MKHIVIKTGIVAAAMLAFAACDNSEYELDNLIPDEFKRVVSIKDSPTGDMELFDIGLEMSSSFTIIRSGGDPSLEAETKIETMTQDELTVYGQNYLLVDPSFYSVPSVVDFSAKEGYKVVNITFAADKIVELRDMCAEAEAEGNAYYVALKLVKSGETTVNDEKFYILRRVVVSDPVLSFNISGDATFKGKTMEMTCSVPFENNFDIAWDITFDTDGIEAANGTAADEGNALEAKTLRHALPLEAIQNADVKGLEQGSSSFSYTVTMPEGTPYGTYYFNVKFGNATLNGTAIETSTGDVDATVRFDYWPDVDVAATGASASALKDYATVIPQSEMTWTPESAQSGSDPAANCIDGNVSNKWENNWGGGYGPTSLPFDACLDLGSEQTVNMIEIWRRNDGMVTDLASVQVYAAESADYSDKENIVYSGLTYLGNLDFEGSSDRVRVFTVPTVTTRYLIYHFNASGRGSSVSISDMAVWTPKVAEEPEEPTDPENPETPEEQPEEGGETAE